MANRRMYPDSTEGESCPGKAGRTSPVGNSAGALPPHPRSFSLSGHLEGFVRHRKKKPLETAPYLQSRLQRLFPL